MNSKIEAAREDLAIKFARYTNVEDILIGLDNQFCLLNGQYQMVHKDYCHLMLIRYPVDASIAKLWDIHSLMLAASESIKQHMIARQSAWMYYESAKVTYNGLTAEEIRIKKIKEEIITIPEPFDIQNLEQFPALA